MIYVQAFGSPSTWNSLDLVELGDLMIVLEESDFTSIDPTSLRMAAHELAVNTKYSDPVDEARHSINPVPQHEACSLWLGGAEGGESEESKSFTDQWRLYNQFIIVGNFLQFEVLENGLENGGLPAPRGEVKRRRKRSVDGQYDFKSNYTYVMGELNEKFQAGELTEVQKINATNIIVSTQTLLADNSFSVLGLERGNLTQKEVLNVLQEYRSSGNMTEEQSALISRLAVDTQVTNEHM